MIFFTSNDRLLSCIVHDSIATELRNPAELKNSFRVVSLWAYVSLDPELAAQYEYNDYKYS